jgi:hypothetical protein
MAIKDSSPEKPRSETPKKKYEKPSFRYERVFVTTALTCGKTFPPTSHACGVTPKVS